MENAGTGSLNQPTAVTDHFRPDMIQIVLYLACIVAFLLCTAQWVRGGLRRLGLFPRSAAGEQGCLGDFADALLLGLIFVTTLVSVISLVHPITGGVQVALGLVVFVCGGPSAIRALRASGQLAALIRCRPLILVLALYLAWAAFVASGVVRLGDTGAYHVQAIRWLKEYGIVPGLTNLYGQLGYNSAWLVFCSLLDHGPFDQGRSYHVANLLVFVYFLAFCLEGCQRFAAGRNSLSTFLRLFGFVAITYYYRDLIASLGTDMVAAVLVHHALVRTCEVMEARSLDDVDGPGERRRMLGFVTAVAVFAVTVKFSVFPCLLFPGLIWLRGRKELTGAVLPSLGIAICLALPFLARNYVLSGYVLYPQTQLDFFRCDWKVPAGDVRWMAYYIREFGIGREQDLDLAGMGIGAKFHTWFNAWGGDRPVRWLLAWVVAGLGCGLVLLWRRSEESRRDWWERWSVFGVIVSGVMFCLVTAPEPRFLGGWGLSLGYFPVAWMASSFANRHVAAPSWCFSGAMTIVFAYWLFLCVPGLLRRTGLNLPNVHWSPGTAASPVQMDSDAGRNGNQFSPDEPVAKRKGLLGIIWTLHNLPAVAMVKEQSTNGVVVNIPVMSEMLWNMPLPAAQRLHPWLQMRGSSLKDGFRVTQETGWTCYDPNHHHRGTPSIPPQP
jgi:hypothetical protein